MTKESIVNDVNSISPDAISGDVKGEFCKIWPTVKTGLELLKKAVPSLTFFIELIITGGDALSKRICA